MRPAKTIDDYRHRDLARCMREIKVDGKPYSIDDLWPGFDGTESAKHDTPDAARGFVD
jgi:hypothetical protein